MISKQKPMCQDTKKIGINYLYGWDVDTKH